MEKFSFIREAHLQFLQQHKDWDPEPSSWNGMYDRSTFHRYNQMLALYCFFEENNKDDYDFLVKWAEYSLKSDIVRFTRRDAISTYIDGLVSQTKRTSSDPDKWFFITVGWLDSIRLTEMKTLSKKVKELKYWDKVYAVNEKHRENGIHYHTHFLVHTELPKSKIFQYIKQVSGMRYVIANYQSKTPSSIDIIKKGEKAPYEVYFNYVHGIKKPEKMPFVEKDKIWRDENKFEF